MGDNVITDGGRHGLTLLVDSPEGRYADKFGYNNTCYTMWLDDLAWDYAGIEAPHRAAVDPSPPAAEILKHEQRGTTRRKIPMTDVARTALVAFLHERVGLLDEIAQTLAQGKDRSAYGRKFLPSRWLSAFMATPLQRLWSTAPQH